MDCPMSSRMERWRLPVRKSLKSIEVISMSFLYSCEEQMILSMAMSILIV